MNWLLPAFQKNASNFKLAKAGTSMNCKRRTVRAARQYATGPAPSPLSDPSETSQSSSSPRQRSNREKKQRHIMSLPGLPISVLPSDIARLLKDHDIRGFHRVQRDYVRFWPTDCLFVVFGTAGERDKAIKVLQTSQMLGINLKPAEVVEAEESRGSDQPRLRGLGGKNEGLERGVVSGNGPAAGLPGSEIGKSVVLSGLPGKLYGGSLKRELLEEFDLREDVKAVVKIADHEGSLFSRFLIRTTSVAEAHRLVRVVRMTPYLGAAWGNRYKIRARVIY